MKPKETFERNTNIETIKRKGLGYKDLPRLDLDFTEKEFEDFKESHKRKKLIVQEVLEGWELCRNVDRILDFECLRTEFKDIQILNTKDTITIKIPKELIWRLPSPESYTRARRSVISDFIKKNDLEKLKELIPTNPNVIERRMKREKTLREYFKGQKREFTIKEKE